MKSMVVYSSRTGNTAKVARAIFEILPKPKVIFPVDEAPPPGDFDFLALGFWVDRGGPDAKARHYMMGLSGATLGLFGTLGAEPDSAHGRSCMARAVDLVAGNHLAGTFLCQGRIDPEVIAAMQRSAAAHHKMTPERLACIRAADSHPDAADLIRAQKAFKAMLAESSAGHNS
jgi:flavodoxin